jgi:hypothetical protein
VEPRASLECLCSWILFDLEISFILYIYIYIYILCVCAGTRSLQVQKIC